MFIDKTVEAANGIASAARVCWCASLLLLTVFGTAAARADINSGLIAYWPFDEQNNPAAIDVVGTANGTPQNGVSWAEGYLEGALFFDGNDDYVQLGNPASLRPTTTMSISAWIYLEGRQSSNWGRVISKTNGSTGDNWAMIATAYNSIDCRIGGTSNRSANNSITQYEWQHIACTYDGASVKVYRNGTLIHSYAKSGAIPTINEVTIGRNATAVNRYFKGGIDDLRVYNRALTQADVIELYSFDGNPFVDTEAPTVPQGLLADEILDNAVTVSWQEATDNIAVAGYTLSRDGTEIVTLPETSYTDTGLPSNTAFSYTVEAYDAAGNRSGPSGPLSVTTTGGPPEMVEISIQKSGDGEGVVTGNGLDCGALCQLQLPVGSLVSLTTQTTETNEFSGWSGPCEGTAACEFTLTQDTIVSADFVIYTPPTPNPEPPTWSAAEAIDGAPFVTTTIVEDFNGDGFTDVAALEGGKHAEGNKLFAWFEAPLMIKHELNPGFAALSSEFMGSAVATDFDQDGDVDIVFSTDHHTLPDEGWVYWAENPGGYAIGDWPIHEIYHFETATQHINDMAVADLDGDGNLDVVVRHLEQDRVRLLFQNSLTDWELVTIDVLPREGLSVGDLDADGRPDIVLNGFWLHSPESPRTGSWTQYSIDSAYYNQPDQGLNNAAKTAIADINSDGIPDVVIASAEGQAAGLAWYENPGDPKVDSWIKRELDPLLGNTHQAEVGDIDLDGDLDVLTGEAFGNTGIHVFYIKTPEFDREQVNDQHGLYFGKLADLDADGDLDVVGPNAYTEQLMVYKNQLNLPDYSVFAVSLSQQGSGNGQILSSRDGLRCDGFDCSEVVLSQAGASVEYTAVPANGSVFTGWGGDCTGTGSCIASVTATVIAYFEHIDTGSSVWYVDYSAASGGDGSSWATAFNSLDEIDWNAVNSDDVVYLNANSVVLKVTNTAD